LYGNHFVGDLTHNRWIVLLYQPNFIDVIVEFRAVPVNGLMVVEKSQPQYPSGFLEQKTVVSSFELVHKSLN